LIPALSVDELVHMNSDNQDCNFINNYTRKEQFYWGSKISLDTNLKIILLET